MTTKYKSHLATIKKRNTTIAEYARNNGLNPRCLYQAKAKLKKYGQPTCDRESVADPNRQFIELPIPKDQPARAARRMELEQGRDGLWSVKLSFLRTNDIRSILGYISNT